MPPTIFSIIKCFKARIALLNNADSQKNMAKDESYWVPGGHKIPGAKPEEK